MTDITAIVNLHNEGQMARASLVNLKRAAEFARQSGLTVEIIAALDRANPETVALAEDMSDTHLRCVYFDHGDLGRSRNNAVEVAQGQWIAFLDGDDLWSENWLTEAHACASADPRFIVWHPEINLYFGDSSGLHIHADMEQTEFEPLALALSNIWTALCFTKRDWLLRVPYPMTDLQNRVGFEDWGWNISIIEHGGLHKVVKGTGHALRTRWNSLAQQSATVRARPDISGLLRLARKQKQESAKR
ncbi:glycosyltransferase family 2 protein [Asticcacaulis tiandongensis]|uniref:glycosyltransferase family 2 protein n=1 Tax=Asticcacaulis tiandongensis TaxID=2565365 RepID=UPI00112D585E|nr:glycosyltransferase [Asticcacaulis tiandongensis]